MTPKQYVENVNRLLNRLTADCTCYAREEPCKDCHEVGLLLADGEQLLRTPTPLWLTCPVCHTRHIDAHLFATKPHHTHACQNCGLTWRPAIVPTVGVHFLPGFRDVVDGVPAPLPNVPPQPDPFAESCATAPAPKSKRKRSKKRAKKGK